MFKQNWDNAGNIQNNVNLCYSYNRRPCEEAVQLLLENAIPFTHNELKIPFFLRKKFRNAHQVYVISINRNTYCQARQTIDRLSPAMKSRLVLSNY